MNISRVRTRATVTIVCTYLILLFSNARQIVFHFMNYSIAFICKNRKNIISAVVMI